MRARQEKQNILCSHPALESESLLEMHRMGLCRDEAVYALETLSIERMDISKLSQIPTALGIQ